MGTQLALGDGIGYFEAAEYLVVKCPILSLALVFKLALRVIMAKRVES